MRTTSKLFLGIGAVAVLSAAASPAFAEPPATPSVSSIVAVGSDTIQGVSDQFQADYTGTPQFFSYDATGSSTITPKKNCAAITRPNGSGAGIAALAANARPSGSPGLFCIDVARSSRALVPGSDPTGLASIPFALDGVTWSANAPTNAPPSLSTTQLTAIYDCDASILGHGGSGPVTWNEVGGTGTAAVVPVLPQSSSGTRSFFLSQIQVTAPGSCVVNGDGSQAIEENEGTNAVFHNGDAANEVFPYSIAVFLAQKFHGKTGSGAPGKLSLHQVNSIPPTTGSGDSKILNKNFPYIRDVYYIVRAAPKTSGYVPPRLQPFLGKNDGSGYICSSAAAPDITSFGFLTLGSQCGKVAQTT